MALDKLKYTYQDPAKVSELNVDDVLNVTNTINTNTINNDTINANTINTNTINSKVQIISSVSSSVSLTVKGAVSSAADLQQWQNSAGISLNSIDASGNMTKGDGDQIVLSSQIF
jgi:hypothetical protein